MLGTEPRNEGNVYNVYLIECHCTLLYIVSVHRFPTHLSSFPVVRHQRTTLAPPAVGEGVMACHNL